MDTFKPYIHRIDYERNGARSELLEFSTNSEPSYLKTFVRVKSEASGETSSEWPTNKFPFKTNHPTQTLAIDLETSEKHEPTGRPLYYFTRIECQRHKLIRNIYYIDASGNLIPVIYTDTFPMHTQQIVIIFKAPRRTEYFKFSAFVRKVDSTEYHDCDPLVGNDPPSENP